MTNDQKITNIQRPMTQHSNLHVRCLVIGRWSLFGHSSWVIGCCVFVALLLSACSSRATDARPDPDTQRLPDVPSVDYPADIDTLAGRLIPWTLVDLHWAALQTDNQVTALRITAINPADQSIEIRAQNIGNGRCAVQIRVGYFGDEKRERAFHDALNAVVKRWREKQKK